MSMHFNRIVRACAFVEFSLIFALSPGVALVQEYTVSGECRDCDPRTIPPTLTFEYVDPPPNNCYEEGEMVEVDVHLGVAAEVIVGAQMMILYDPTCLAFESILPGADYPLELYETVNEVAGEIFYAVGIQIGGVGTHGNTTLAHITFTKIGECNDCILCFGGENPRNTYLSDDQGQVVFVDPQCSEYIYEKDEVTLWVPDSVEVDADSGGNTATVSWDVPWSSSDCDYDVNLVCAGEHESGYVYDQETLMNGGEMPLGLSAFCCTATGSLCGQALDACWTVTVNDPGGQANRLLPASDGVCATDHDCNTIETGQAVCIDGYCYTPKNRYLTLTVAAPPAGVTAEALLVTFASLPAKYSFVEGDQMWVGEPDPTTGISRLGSTPVFTDWWNKGMIKVADCNIVPGAEYQIEAVPENRSVKQSYSNLLQLPTVAKWGDIVGPFDAAADRYTSPDGEVNFIDIVAVVDGFIGIPTGPPKPCTDIAQDLPDGNVDFCDISAVVDAFQGVPYPYEGPQGSSGTCMPG